MQASLLRTKLHRPASVPTEIPRLRLLRRLQEGLRSKVTLVSAAAGSGKTTILTAWLAHLTTSSAPLASKVSWLTVDKADNQLPRFLGYLAATIEANFPHSCLAVAAVQQQNPDPTIEALAEMLANSLALLPSQLVLVLDDLHLIDNAAIYALLADLVHHAPATFHLVLSTRIDPPLPLTRWRARGWLNEVRQQELSFTVEEATAFLVKSLESPPPPEVSAALHKQTEGWPVGLRLAALALRGHADPVLFLADVVANRNRYVIDYLRDDVLDQQPAVVQEFLVCTAILKRFCPTLCSAVLQIDEATAQQQLQYVERANLFLVELSSPSLWYRYHQQFQTMLLAKLHERYTPSDVVLLQQRAAAWLAEHGALQEALDCLTTIADFDAAADLIEKHRVALLTEQRFQELADALTFIPEILIKQRPLLLLSRAWVHTHRLDNGQCAAVVQQLEHLLITQSVAMPEATQCLIQLELVALQCALDQVQENTVSLAQIQTVWVGVQPYLMHVFSDVVIPLADRCQRLGAAEMGLAMFTTALAPVGDRSPMARCLLLNARALLYFYECNLQQAESDFQTNLHQARQFGFTLIATFSRLMLGVIASARHQTTVAEACYIELLTTPHFHWHVGRYAVISLLKLIELYTFQACPQRAYPFLNRLKEHAQAVGLHYLHDQVAALEAYLASACGDRPPALRWALDGLHTPLNRTMLSSADRLPVIRVRILLAEGSPASLHKASQILQEFLHYQERQHRKYYLVEALILLALIWAKLEQMERALATLGQVVDMAVPHGIIGHFILQGPPLKVLLHTLRQQSNDKALVDLLLAAFPAVDVAPIQSVKQENTLLTDRELDVLRLLAERLSNKEIAERLVISTHTVRNHRANLFSKLQVSSRAQAIAHARALGLLSTG